MASKKVSEYGVKLLDELEVERTDFQAGKVEPENARAFSSLANSTSRAMKETLTAKRYETAVAVAAA